MSTPENSDAERCNDWYREALIDSIRWQSDKAWIAGTERCVRAKTDPDDLWIRRFGVNS